MPLPARGAQCFHLSQHHCLGILPTFLVNLLRVRIAPGSVLLKSIKKASSLLTRGVCSFILCVPRAISTVSFKSHNAATRRGETGCEFWRLENWVCARRYEPVSPFAHLWAPIPGGPERQGWKTKQNHERNLVGRRSRGTRSLLEYEMGIFSDSRSPNIYVSGAQQCVASIFEKKCSYYFTCKPDSFSFS